MQKLNLLIMQKKCAGEFYPQKKLRNVLSKCYLEEHGESCFALMLNEYQRKCHFDENDQCLSLTSVCQIHNDQRNHHHVLLAFDAL